MGTGSSEDKRKHKRQLKNVVSEIFEEGGIRMEWISVKDKLPELENDQDVVHVLIHLDDGFITGADYEKDGFELWAESGEVTHWMPLPEPPIHA